MAVTADQVVVELEARIDGYNADVRAAVGAFESGMDRIQRAGLLAEGATARLGAGIGTLQSIVAGFAGGIASTLFTTLPGLLTEAAKKAVEYAGSLGETSQQLGVTTKFLQEFQFAATQSGASSAQADTALARFSKTVGEAAEGNKRARGAFDALGVSIKDANGNLVPTEELFRRVADAIAKINDPARQSAAAVELFGRGGQAIIPVLAAGRDGFNEMAAAAGKLGLVLSDETINKLDQLSDKAAAIKKVITVQLAAAIGQNADAILALGQAGANAAIGLSSFVTRLTAARAVANSRGGGIAGGLREIFDSSGADLDQASSPKGRVALFTKSSDDLKKAIAQGAGILPASDLDALKKQLAQQLAFLKNAQDELKSLTLPPVATGKSGGAVIDPAVKAPKVKAPRADKPAPNLDGLDPFAGNAGKDAEANFAKFDKEAADTAASIEKNFKAAFGDAAAEELPQVKSQLEKIGAEAERAAEAGKRFSQDLSYGLADAIVNGKNLGDVLVDSLKRAAVEALASGIFKLIGGAVGGIFSSLFGSLGSPHAIGGPVTGGTSYLVGEKGPELFTPQGMGDIRPAGSFGGGATAIYVTQSLHFDVGLESVDQRISQAAPVLLGAAQKGTMDALRNSGIGRV